ncbi:MAG: imidazoleglycerol-phosphate dehydratase HisB [Clostridia bacterium]|nr:imidazoleglycerol-phosphate dehydratase HisB [Clostridia bacterium]MBQ7112652.1 imidazoleglycerol-phosphate dehydratase HisB [Clostridia bacterium]
MRNATIERTTKETAISLALTLEGSGKNEIASGCGFLDHMLTLFAVHGRFDITLSCKGDTFVDDHHTVEDIGIALGEAFKAALGDKRGITRYGSIILPMDEALILAAVDISGRGMLVYDMPIPTEKVGSFDTELVKEFLIAFTRKAEITLHVKELAGENSHHIIEGCFKALARALRTAVKIDAETANEVPSSKGVL